jgi:hypothetical protein
MLSIPISFLCFATYSFRLSYGRLYAICSQPSVRNDNLVTESHSLQSSEFHFSYFVPSTRKEYFNPEYERYICMLNFLIKRPFPRHSWNYFKALEKTYDAITQWSRALWITSHKTLGNFWYQNVPCRFHKSSPFFPILYHMTRAYVLQNCFFKIRYFVRGYCIKYWFFMQ